VKKSPVTQTFSRGCRGDALHRPGNAKRRTIEGSTSQPGKE
jgi:hypothetical protein